VARWIPSGSRSTGRRWSSWTSTGSAAAVVALGATGLLATVAGLLDLVGDGDDTAVLLVVGGLLGVGAGLLRAATRPAERIRDADVLVATVAGLVGFLLGVAGLLLATGLAPATTSGLVDALADATAVGTTTALGVLQPALDDHAGRFLLAGAQWLGGLGALMVGVAVLPFFGAGREFADRSRRGGRRPMTPDQATAVRNIMAIHGTVSALTWVAYAVAGAEPFDALLLGMATASTGGRAVGAPLDTAALQWVAVGGMLVAGTSLVVLWRLAHGRARNLWRSDELQIYVGLVVVGTLLLLLWTDGGGPDGLRGAAFTVTAALTTTGFPSAPEGTWAPAAPILVLGLASIGPMVGSAGGGFQILRHRILAQAAVREMLRQMHPRSLTLVRLGGRVADEDTLSKVVVTQFLFVSVLFGTALVVAIGGLDLATALGAAVHAISTAGPVRTVDGVVVDPASWPDGVRLALLPAMVIGRLSVYPAFVAVGAGVTVARDRVGIRRRWRSLRSWRRARGMVNRS